MGKKNAYLQKQKLINKAYSDASEAVMRQFMIDTMMIAVGEEFGFGPDRMERLIRKWGEVYSKYYPCLNIRSSDEADYMRVKLDEEIKPLVSENFVFLTFEERYPDLKRAKY